MLLNAIRFVVALPSSTRAEVLVVGVTKFNAGKLVQEFTSLASELVMTLLLTR